MEDGYLKIILFAALAAFLIFRLRRELGKRTGHQGQRPDARLPPRSREEPEEAAADNVLQLPDRSEELPPDSPLGAGLTQIQVHDSNFEPDSFLSGAKAAFEIIVGAFAAGDRTALRPLLSGEVYDDFAGAIEARFEEGEQTETSVVGIKSADIIEAGMEGRDAVVTVKFVSDQTNVTRNRDGKVIGGHPERIVEVTDIWTFQRDTRRRDPNWSLVATRTPN
ncbi:MAG: Tim44/TimA family putative adaptor protein [Kiloniellales bacterium]